MNDQYEKELKAMELLARGRLESEIADILDVTIDDIRDWKERPILGMMINQLRSEALSQSIAAIQSSTPDAVYALRDLAKTSKNDETRRKAACDLIRMAGLEPDSHDTYLWNIV